MSRRWAAMVLTAAAALTGCDRGSDDPALSGSGSATTTTSFTRPPGGGGGVGASTSTAPATTQAAESLLNIDGNLVLFPAAKLRIDEADGKVVARLFSDDPKRAALDEDYEGNSFYLQIEIEPEDAKDLDGVTLKYHAPSRERDDSPYGIFLEGRRWLLQPASLTFTFTGAQPTIDVRLNGTFLLFDANDVTAKPREASVSGKLSAAVQAGK